MFRGIRTIAGITALSTLTGCRLYSDLVDTHKLLIEKSKERLGVFVWGSNDTGLISANPEPIREPKEFQVEFINQYFGGTMLKSLYFGKTHAAAIDHNGNLLQWGNLRLGEPNITLKGKNLLQAVCTDNHVFALSKNGTVYQLSRCEHQKGWTSNLELQISMPLKRNWFEKIVSISAGSDFVVGLSSAGKVFDHELNTLNPSELSGTVVEWNAIDGFDNQTVKQVATGLYHSVFLTTDGTIYTKGWNRFGQLGLTDLDIGIRVDKPRQVSFKYPKGSICSQIAAGGNTSFFIISQDDVNQVYSCGTGQFGQLGSGGFYHAQGTLKPVKFLSNLQEFNEEKKKSVSIPISSLHISPSHCAAVVGSSNLFGKDTYFWGHKDGLCRWDGKQSHCPTPGLSKPLFTSLLNERLQLAPMGRLKGGVGEQSIALGDGITAVYFKF
jgi:alpha-tubulin suppressor-like RCC1 family protein